MTVPLGLVLEPVASLPPLANVKPAINRNNNDATNAVRPFMITSVPTLLQASAFGILARAPAVNDYLRTADHSSGTAFASATCLYQRPLLFGMRACVA